MALPSLAIDGAISDLSQKWGSGALRWGGMGLLQQPSDVPSIVPAGVSSDVPAAVPSNLPRGVPGASGTSLDPIVPTGFAALDAILGPGGLPRATTATLKGDVSSGKTTLALRLCAE